MFVSVVSALPAAAAPPTVNCPNSPCSASLIQSAIDSAPSGSIVGVGAGTYQGDITIDHSVTLQADGPVTINGQNSASNPGTTVFVPGPVVATINGLTITGGYANAHATHSVAERWGGGIHNDGTLTVVNSVVTGNNGARGEGGGIFNDGFDGPGRLTISGTTITGNTSAFGGGMANYGAMVLSDSTVSNNSAAFNGGGLDNAFGSGATISNSTFSGNTSRHQCGGAINNFESTLTVVNSTIEHNSAARSGGGIHNWVGTTPPGTVSLKDNVILYNTPDNCAGDLSC